jgi:hypothetical protein
MNLPLESIAIPNWPFRVLGIAYGRGARLQLEVLYSESDRPPVPTQLRAAWKARQDRRGVPLLIVVNHGNGVHVCGPSGDDPTVYPDLDSGQVERICLEALEQPSRQAALRSLRDSLGALEGDGLPGLRNEGFLAAHELVNGVPNRNDWVAAGTSGRAAMGRAGQELLTALGFTSEPLDNVTTILRSGDRKTAIAVLLNERESPESGSDRVPGAMSPVSYALARADEQNLDWVVLLHGRKIRLYPARMGVGVGRRGRTETFIECHTGLLPDDQAAYIWLLFSAPALRRDGSLADIMADSRDFAGDLAGRLRERIYDEVIPRLAEGLAEARGLTAPSAEQLAETYQMAMRVLFRLLFLAYGEDKDLLPYRFNGLYQKRSLKAKARELMELAPDQFDDGDSWWQEVQAIFKAVDKGNRDWGVPAYNGGLFSGDHAESPIGAALDGISLPNRVFGPTLQHLLLVPTAEGVLGPVDFRSLGVREFGTIYEGLLESELSVAETDLTVETRGANKDVYRPCVPGEDPVVPRGGVYLHNASGARKSTGSFYTKHFAVEHLLDKALEPALDDHFARLNALDELEAAEGFFDFRVADIAMGSGHFLVAAVDRIEARFSGYLARRPLPQVARELAHLRAAAQEALGEAADSYPEFEDTALMRRLIARRCIYGVDINEVAVQLARLAIWIHTFVPGLPLSLLDRNLVHGNSLIGVGHLSELEDKVRQEGLVMFAASAADLVGDAREALIRLGRLADATRSEVLAARKAWADADAATAPARALCDILTAARIEGTNMPFDFTRWRDEKTKVVGGEPHRHAAVVLAGMHQIHFPVVFPEVFLRARQGFDVILGNPPWEKVHVEEHEFWARHVPGLRGLAQRDRERLYDELRRTRPDLQLCLDEEIRAARGLREALMRGPFPGMGSGHPDLYKAFCWRFWFLVVEAGGRIGVVLPRSVVAAKGSEEFRWRTFREAKKVDATMLLNSGRWVFDIHPQYTIGLLAAERRSCGSSGTTITMDGPYNSRAAYEARVEHGGASFSGEEVLSWNDTASLPLLPKSDSGEVFAHLRKTPRLDQDSPGEWTARPIQGDLNATTAKPIMSFLDDRPACFWPVYKGASFDIWEPDTGEYYAWADPAVVAPVLQDKRERGKLNQGSVFHECDAHWCSDAATLPCRNPRIAFRDVTRATDSRTLRCALVPPGVFLSHTAPYLVFPKGTALDVAYLLGIMSSLPLDWYARRFVETHMTFFVLNPFPVPRPNTENVLRRRVVQLAGRLACPDDRFAVWARDVGVECGPLAADEKQDMIHELDAVAAHLYGLKQKHLVHIFETFHEGWNHQPRLDATLRHYREWKKRLVS